MTWTKQEPADKAWDKREGGTTRWPKFDPFAQQTLWDVGETLWDEPNETLWDYTPIYTEIWSKQ